MTKLASMLTSSPIPLLAEHLYRPASSRDTLVNLRDKELFPLTKPSVIAISLSCRLHVIVDAGLLNTMQFRDPENVSMIWTPVVDNSGASTQHTS